MQAMSAQVHNAGGRMYVGGGRKVSLLEPQEDWHRLAQPAAPSLVWAGGMGECSSSGLGKGCEGHHEVGGLGVWRKEC